jgi:Transglycosylase SLT domain
MLRRGLFPEVPRPRGRKRAPDAANASPSPPASTRPQVRCARRVVCRAACVMGLALIIPASGARAELWGYLDAGGAPHFATEKLDERYQLFYKGETNLDAAARARAAAPSEDDFARSRIFRYVTGHPNAARFASLIERDAQLNGLDPALVKAVIAVESGFDPAAVSAKGALGLMQITPDTAVRYGTAADKARPLEAKLFDPAINVSIGTRYLHDLMAIFDNDIGLALAAYNAGADAVRRYQPGIPPFPETQEYVKLVRQFYALYRPPPAPPPVRPLIPRRQKMPQ